ncbi:hypothetical protein Tco_0641255 [Tanacetum coccineum]
MVEENVPAPAPTRADEHILPFKAWLPVGKGHSLHQQMSLLSTFNSSGIPLLRIQSLGNTASNWISNGLLSMLISFCLTGKTSGNDKPRHPVLQMLWGIVTRTNVDYAKLLWEEFVQAIKIFFAYRASLNVPTKKPTPQYLEMVARKPTAKEGGQKKTSSKADKPTLVKKPAPAKQTKPMKEKSTKPTPSTKASKGKVLKGRKGKRSNCLVDKEEEEPQLAPEPQIEDDEYNLQRVYIKLNITYRLELPQELSRVHNVFHVCNLKKCLSDDTLVIPLEEIQLDDKLNFVEEPVEIMDREVKQLKRSCIPIVKVRWNARRGPEYTWELQSAVLSNSSPVVATSEHAVSWHPSTVPKPHEKLWPHSP